MSWSKKKILFLSTFGNKITGQQQLTSKMFTILPLEKGWNPSAVWTRGTRISQPFIIPIHSLADQMRVYHQYHWDYTPPPKSLPFYVRDITRQEFVGLPLVSRLPFHLPSPGEKKSSEQRTKEIIHSYHVKNLLKRLIFLFLWLQSSASWSKGSIGGSGGTLQGSWGFGETRNIPHLFSETGNGLSSLKDFWIIYKHSSRRIQSSGFVLISFTFVCLRNEHGILLFSNLPVQFFICSLDKENNYFFYSIPLVITLALLVPHFPFFSLCWQ